MPCNALSLVMRSSTFQIWKYCAHMPNALRHPLASLAFPLFLSFFLSVASLLSVRVYILLGENMLTHSKLMRRTWIKPIPWLINFWLYTLFTMRISSFLSKNNHYKMIHIFTSSLIPSKIKPHKRQHRDFGMLSIHLGSSNQQVERLEQHERIECISFFINSILRKFIGSNSKYCC